MDIGIDNHPDFELTTYRSFSITTGYNFDDEPLINHTMSHIENPLSLNIVSSSYEAQINSSKSYVISIPDSLNYSINTIPWENLDVDLP